MIRCVTSTLVFAEEHETKDRELKANSMELKALRKIEIEEEVKHVGVN